MLFNKIPGKKDSFLFANKLIEKLLDPRNAKEHCQSYKRKNQ